MNPIQSSCVEPCGGFLESLAALRLAESPIHIMEVNYLVKVSHAACLSFIYPFGKGCAFF
jgi:hypothetical protein